MRKITIDNKTGLAIASVLVLFAVVSRLAPHPANFAPIGAIALFGGALLPRGLALSLPLVAMIISDLFIGIHSLIFYTWGSFALIALLSSYRFKVINAANVLAGSLSASILFYLISNFGVWLEGRLYPQTFSGLMSSYYNAIPFFRNTLLGDLVYSAMLFGAYAIVYSYVHDRKVAKEVAS